MSKFKVGDKIYLDDELLTDRSCYGIVTGFKGDEYVYDIFYSDDDSLKRNRFTFPMAYIDNNNEFIEEDVIYENPETGFKMSYETGASETQIGGDHYKSLKIQPMQYALENDLNYAQANSIKYITRYKNKNGVEDLKKAIHCIELLIEHEEK